MNELQLSQLQLAILQQLKTGIEQATLAHSEFLTMCMKASGVNLPDGHPIQIKDGKLLWEAPKETL